MLVFRSVLLGRYLDGYTLCPRLTLVYRRPWLFVFHLSAITVSLPSPTSITAEQYSKTMHLTRLSRIETVPSPSQSRPPSAPTSSLTINLLPHLTTFLFLLISSILIFLSLLLPNSTSHLSSFSIRPVNKIYVPATLISAGTSTSTSTTSEKPLATGMWGQDESEIQPSAVTGLSRNPVPIENVTWYGILGPEVWAGPMRE
jgi:hypothetical protein